MSKKFNRRYLAHIVVEADTPLASASGRSDIFTDSLVCTDANSLPLIHGTTLAGVVRHQMAREGIVDVDCLFGFQREKKEEGQGSRLIFSHAHLLDADGKAVEGLLSPQCLSEDQYLGKLLELPIRQHCRIDHRGVADQKKRGKFDTQVVPRGVRFMFSLELIGSEEDAAAWKKILATFSHPAFRIGGGTRKGFGKLKIIADLSQTRIFDLNVTEDLEAYTTISCSLNEELKGARLAVEKPERSSDWISYHISIAPENTWLFGSGFGDGTIDITPVYECFVKWNGRPQFTDCYLLVPATSIKGAISHRVAFHYNRLMRRFADEVGILQHVGENNPAVEALFGRARDSQKDTGTIGRLILSDLFLEDKQQNKIFQHVAIDRFTGGTIDGALFCERVIRQKNKFNLRLLVRTDAFDKKYVKEAFESTLDDICKGRLPLGGGVMRGHGIFTGSWLKN